MNQDQQRLQCQCRNWIGFGIVAAVAVLTRGAVIAAALLGLGPLDHLREDPDSYREIAETLAVSGTFGIPAEAGSVDPTAFRPPLYPWVLSWIVVDGRLGSAAVGLLHLLIGVLTCLGVYATLKRFPMQLGGERIAVAAGCLAAVDPLLLMQSTLVMTETLAAGIAVAAWWAATQDTGGTGEIPGQRRRIGRAGSWGWGVAVGGLLAAGYLCRPVFAVWIALWVVWLVAVWFRRARPPHRARQWAGRQTIAILAVVAVTAAGWMFRNQQVIGKAVWATTHGGYTLLLGNNPYFYDYLDSRSFAAAAFWGDAWNAEAFHRDWGARLDRLSDSLPSGAEGGQLKEDPELAADRLAAEWAKQEIRRRPGMFVYASLVRVGRLWSPVPRVGDRVGPVSWAIGAFYAVLGVGVVRGVWRLRQHLFSPAWAPPLLLCVAVTAVHAVYWSNLRMRAPVMPMVAAIAAVGLVGSSRFSERAQK